MKNFLAIRETSTFFWTKSLLRRAKDDIVLIGTGVGH